YFIGNNTILVMTKDFDVITEFPISVEETGEAVSVSVGWGKKETQFHGSAGKSAAQNKVDISGFTISQDDDSKPRVSWIGDGSMFCCSIIDPDKGLRVIRVYNREGVLQYTSEPVDKLEHVLSWRPLGNLITSSQKLPNKHEIIFFEKNGLRHGEFSLRETQPHKIIEILWNCDSTVLAVWIERIISDTEHSTFQLWNMNNYYWYLKQEIQCQFGSKITSVAWDIEKALRLHYTTTNDYYCLDFCWDIFSANTISDKNVAPVAVIDGFSVNLTPFRVMNVPPPMFAFSVQLSNPTSSVSFLPNNGGNYFAVLEANQQITLFEWSGALERPIKAPTCIGSIQVKDSNNDQGILRQIVWFNQSVIYCLHSIKDKNNYDNLVAIYLTYDENGNAKCMSYEKYNICQKVLRLYFNPNYEELWFENTFGKVFKVYMDQINKFIENNDPTIKIKIQDDSFSFPEVCNWISLTKIGRDERTENAIIGLSENNKLYGNHINISTECTSFFIHNDFLIFTTLSNTVKFLPLQANLSGKEIKNFNNNESHPYDETVRKIERGAKIICAVYFDVFLILQMPRGNLETVHPRALVLSSVRESLNRLDYLSAYMTCRKHRIDLNILYDHEPESFLNNVELFVNQVEKVDYLNLFLSSLRNEDVTKTMYPKIAIGSKSSIPDDTETLDVTIKVNSICDAIRGILESLDFKKYLQSIITTFVKKSPPELESALNFLAKLKDQDLSLAEDAVKYAIFLVDADKLFDVALGMYDFSLVLLVAQQSQKDPREYLSFLAELESHPKYYQRFKIDDHLNRYEKALYNLSLAGENYFEQCLIYLQEHQLYKSAINIFSNDNERYKRVMSLYGDYLGEESNFEEAGLAYVMAGNKSSALEAYKKSGAWREAFAIAQELKYSSDEMFLLSKELSETLADKRQYQEAAQILLDYTRQPEDAVVLLNKGHHWKEAIRISYMYDRADLIETNVRPSVLEGHNNLLQDINSMLDQLSLQTVRLQEILLNNAKQSDLEQFENDEAMDNVDVFSDTSSMASGFTRYTKSNTQLSIQSTKSGKSAKSRRRAERKKARGKKGSIYEKEYLYDSLRRLIERFNNTKVEVTNLLSCLVTLGYLKNAQQIQNVFENLEEKIKNNIDKIFVIPSITTTNITSNVNINNNSELLINQQNSVNLAMYEKPKLNLINWKLQIIR
ncbi:IKI3 family-domain-containing protein, partial [Glomus cerebriforme]